MKWRKETTCYMWANYFSEDGRYKAYDKDVYVESSKNYYNPKTRKMEPKMVAKHTWFLEDLNTGEIVFEGKTLKACKEYAETH